MEGQEKDRGQEPWITLEQLKAKSAAADALKMQGDEQFFGKLEEAVDRFSRIDLQELIDGINGIVSQDSQDDASAKSSQA